MGIPKSAEIHAEDQVRLKPLFGLRPGVYLAILYVAILLLIGFGTLLYPGLAHPGSVIILKTEPAGAALRVDGVYMGTEADRIFVPQGRRSLELVLPGFSPERIECDIPGRLFASALFPRRYLLERTLRSPDPAAAFAEAAADYAAWTFGGEPAAAWQVPLSLSEGAYRLGPAAGPGGLEQIIRAAARFGTTRAALRDLLRAKALADNGGLAPSPLSLARSAADIAGFLSENPAAAAWLAETLPPESAVLLTASAWYQKQLASFAEITAVQSLAPPSSGKAPPARQLTVGGLSFTGIAGGTLVQDEPFPHPVPVDAFLIAGAEITREAFDNFLEANPRWRPEQRESLIEQGLAAAGYLRDDGFTAGGRTLDRAAPGSETGRTAVSWFAAAAYCEWLSARLPPALAGWVVRLPTEAEWEYAAKLVKSGRADMEIRGMEDGAWEWCADPYAPLAFLTATDEAIAAVGSPERSVRGGSWFNPAGAEARASLPPSSCSPFVSFRPVIARAPGQAAH